MSKLQIPVFACVLILVLTACSGLSAPDQTASAAGSRTAVSSIGSEAQLLKAAPDVTFREGTTSGGRVVLSSGDIVGFHTKYTKFNHSYEIAFELTEAGRKKFAEETTKLLGNTVSIWAGNDLLNSSEVEAPITDGTVAFTAKADDTMQSICKKLEGQSK